MDRSFDKLKLAKFWDVVSRNPFFEEVAQYWELEVLAVHSAYQRRGVGSMLLQWGMVQAQRQGLPVVVAATSSGEGLYRKHGFEESSRISLPQSEVSWVALVWYPAQS